MTDRPINALPEGIELDGYVFGDVLGRGGFGITYRAEEKLSGRPVAIKEYFPGDIVARIGASATVRPISSQLEPGFRAGRAKFIDEARIIARLNHPGVVRVLRVFEANATAYYVMEYEHGTSLAQRLAGGPLVEAALRPLLAALLDGLDAVHRANVLHRDIKPSNILVLPDGAPKLIDFGAAKSDLARLTRSTEKIVTPGYSPWEQYDADGQLGPWSDLYAVGATAYRCLTGTVPPPADRRAKSVLDKTPDPLRPLAEIAAGNFSPGLVAAVDAALRMIETARPQTVAEFRALLDGASDDVRTRNRSGPRAAPAPRGTARRRALAAGLGVAAIAAAGYLVSGPIEHWLMAREFAAAQDAFAAGDFKTALARYKRPAEAGLAEAQYRLAAILQRGLADAPAPAEALTWYERAARQNHKLAIHEMALMYFYGAGVARDYRAARQLLARAAALEHGDACYHLGIMDEQGLGADANDDTALGWYRKADTLGVRDAAARIREIEARRAKPELELLLDGERHPDKIFTAEFSRDGRRIVTACEDGRIRFVDAATGRIQRVVAALSDKVFAATVGRGGKYIVAAGRDRSVRVYDAASGAERYNFSGHTNWVNYAVLSPDETLAASASGDGTVRIWPLAGGAGRILRHPGAMRIVAFNPAGSELATGGEDGPVRLWNAATGLQLRPLTRGEGRPHSLEYNAAGTRLLVGEHDGRVAILDPAGAARDIDMRGHAGAVYSAAFDRAGRVVASAGHDGTLRLWNAATGAPLEQRRAHNGSVVYAASFDPAGERLVTAAADGSLKIWSLKRRG